MISDSLIVPDSSIGNVLPVMNANCTRTRIVGCYVLGNNKTRAVANDIGSVDFYSGNDLFSLIYRPGRRVDANADPLFFTVHLSKS